MVVYNPQYTNYLNNQYYYPQHNNQFYGSSTTAATAAAAGVDNNNFYNQQQQINALVTDDNNSSGYQQNAYATNDFNYQAGLNYYYQQPQQNAINNTYQHTTTVAAIKAQPSKPQRRTKKSTSPQSTAAKTTTTSLAKNAQKPQKSSKSGASVGGVNYFQQCINASLVRLQYRLNSLNIQLTLSPNLIPADGDCLINSLIDNLYINYPVLVDVNPTPSDGGKNVAVADADKRHLERQLLCRSVADIRAEWAEAGKRILPAYFNTAADASGTAAADMIAALNEWKRPGIYVTSSDVVSDSVVTLAATMLRRHILVVHGDAEGCGEGVNGVTLVSGNTMVPNNVVCHVPLFLGRVESPVPHYQSLKAVDVMVQPGEEGGCTTTTTRGGFWHELKKLV